MRIEIPESVQVTVRGLISRGVRAVSKSDTGHLIFVLTDGSTVDLGQVDGADGVTPHIGENRHWYIGTVDTGIVAEGQDGAPGTPGTPGKDGDPGADGAMWWLTDEELMETLPDGTGLAAFLPMSAFYGHSGAKPAAGDMVLSTANGVINYITAASGQQVTCLSTVLNLTGKAGDDGYSPEAAVSKTGKVATITIKDKSGTTTATVRDGEDGATGKDGINGLTPFIGANGNWWIGDTDTGISALGIKGDKGAKGDPGAQGDPGKDGAPGAPGADGQTPYIGDNGNWWIGDVDTGKPSRGEKGESGDAPKNLFSFENGNAYVSLLSKNHPESEYVVATSTTYGHKDVNNNYYVFSGGTQNYGITEAMPKKLPAGNYNFSAEIYIPSGNTTRTSVQWGAVTFPADSAGVYDQRSKFDLATQNKWVKVEKIVTVTAEHTVVYVSPQSYIETYPFYVRNIQVISLEPELEGWEGKKWVAIGDSITEHNNKALKNYHDYIAEKTGIAVVNMGLSGSGYKAKESDNGAFYQRVSNVPTDADVITIFGSGNDLGGSYQIGEASDTGTETLCGCVNTALDNLFAVVPTAQLGIITSIPWGGFNPSDDTNLMAQYSAKIVEICRRRGIPCLDLYHCSGLRPWDIAFQAVAYPANSSGTGYDSVHPNAVGHAFFAPKIKAFLDSLVL